MEALPSVQIELSQLIRIGWMLLIPLGILLVAVLYKVFFLLHNVNEFLTLSRYEIYPTLKDLKEVVANVEVISEKAVSGIESLEKGMDATRSKMEGLTDISKGVLGTMGELAGGALRGLFSKGRK